MWIVIARDAMREARFAKQIEEGFFPAGTELSPQPANIPAWATLSDAEREEWSQKMAIYAAVVEIMDRGVGRILDQVEKAGIDDNTLVVFLSDNGSCPFPVNYKKCEPGSVPGGKGSAVSYDYPWANVNATPYRFFERWTYKGGIHASCVVRWPGKVEPSSMCGVMAHVMDFLPTFFDLCGGDRPSEYNGVALNPMDGVSIAGVLQGQTEPVHEVLCWEHYGNKAIRK